MRALHVRLGLDRPVVQWSLVVLSLVVMALGLRTMTVAIRLRRTVEQLERANRVLQEGQDEWQRERGEWQARRTPAVVQQEQQPSFTLSAGLPARVGPPTRFPVPETAEILRLQLTVPPQLSSSRFRAGLRGAPGDEFWSEGRLRPEQNGQHALIRLVLPSAPLVPGHYELALQSDDPGHAGDVSYYYFEVVRP